MHPHWGLGRVVSDRRYSRARRPWSWSSTSLSAVPAGIAGCLNLYHVISSPDDYFGPNGDLARIPQTWQGAWESGRHRRRVLAGVSYCAIAACA